MVLSTIRFLEYPFVLCLALEAQKKMQLQLRRSTNKFIVQSDVSLITFSSDLTLPYGFFRPKYLNNQLIALSLFG